MQKRHSISAQPCSHPCAPLHPSLTWGQPLFDPGRECAAAGIAFVGPLPETIEAMGDKTAARRLAIECGVPVVPGMDRALGSAAEARAFAEQVGGGGG